MPEPQIPEIAIEPSFVQNIIVDRVNLSDGSTIPIPIRRLENTSHFSFYPKVFFKLNSDELNIDYSANTQFGNDLNIIPLIKELFSNPNFNSIVRIGVTSDESNDIYDKRVNRILNILKEDGTKNFNHLRFEKAITDVSRQIPEILEESRYAWFLISDDNHYTMRSLKILDYSLSSSMRTVLHFKAELSDETELLNYKLIVEFENNIIHSSDHLESIFQFTDDFLNNDFTSSREMTITTKFKTIDGFDKKIVNTLNIEPYLNRVDRIINGDINNELMVLGFFEFDSDKLLNFDKNVVEKAIFDAVRGKKVTIIPTTDNIGTPRYNRELAKRRADAALNLLKMNEETYSIEYPQNYFFDNATPMGRMFNRSVLIRIETE